LNRKSFLLSCALVAACCSLTFAQTAAQGGPQAGGSQAGGPQAGGSSGGGWVVVLDVAKVFKANADFDTKMKLIKADAEKYQASFKAEQEKLQLDAQQLQGMEASSEPRFQLEAQLEQRSTALKTKARQAETELLIKEAQAYYETYQKMQSVVGSLAEQHGIVMVLRFDSEEIDPSNRGDVIKGVNRAVVYHKQLDITQEVIRAMGPVVTSNAATPGSFKAP
jgi:Skp family chaperone for outer membrane proteins